jgi:ATP synthase protein I
MNSNNLPNNRQRQRRADFTQQIAAKEARKLRARQEHNQSLWFGLGLLGLVGWSIVLPTLLGLALGLWIDGRFPSQFSWTLMLMVAGLGLGCLNAWKWVEGEQATMIHPRRQPPVASPPPTQPNTLNGESNYE